MPLVRDVKRSCCKYSCHARSLLRQGESLRVPVTSCAGGYVRLNESHVFPLVRRMRDIPPYLPCGFGVPWRTTLEEGRFTATRWPLMLWKRCDFSVPAILSCSRLMQRLWCQQYGSVHNPLPIEPNTPNSLRGVGLRIGLPSRRFGHRFGHGFPERHDIRIPVPEE